jgi:hypothetical protein
MVGSYDSTRDHRPLASYVLGHRSRSIWLWHDLFWHGYFIDVNTVAFSQLRYEDGPLAAAREMQWAILILAKEIHPNLYLHLYKSVSAFGKLPRKLIKIWHASDTTVRKQFLNTQPEGHKEWQRLKWLADSSLEKVASPLLEFMTLGRVVGSYELDVWLTRIPQRPGELAGLPAIAPVITFAKNLATQFLDLCPLLRELIDREPTLLNEGLDAYFDAVCKNQGLRVFPVVDRILELLNEEIKEALSELSLSELARDRSYQNYASTAEPQTESQGTNVYIHEEAVITDEYLFARCGEMYRIVFTKQDGSKEVGNFSPRIGFILIHYLIERPRRYFAAIELLEAAGRGANRQEIAFEESEIESLGRRARYAPDAKITAQSLPALKKEMFDRLDMIDHYRQAYKWDEEEAELECGQGSRCEMRDS